jgi:hypothetical protein
MKAPGVVVVLVVLSLLMLAMAVRIVKQYENGVPGVWCSDSAGQKAFIRTTLRAQNASNKSNRYRVI